MKLTYRYYWKELSSDGFLKEPEDLEPYYDTDRFNRYGGEGFESEEEANQHLLSLAQKYSGLYLTGLILIKEVSGI